MSKSPSTESQSFSSPEQVYRRLNQDGDLDPIFLADEYVYIRTSKSLVRENGKLNPQALRCDNQSCNRSKYSAAYDVLYVVKQGNAVKLDGDLVVCRAPVSKIPPFIIEDSNKKRWTLKVVHAPHPSGGRNYPHSEIRVFRDEKFIGSYDGGIKKKAGKIVENKFKGDVAECFELVKLDLAPLEPPRLSVEDTAVADSQRPEQEVGARNSP